MKSFSEKTKKPSYRQLEKEIERLKKSDDNRRELFMKVTRELSVFKNAYREIQKSNDTYLAAIVFNQGVKVGDDAYEIAVPNRELAWAMKNLKVSSTESENKQVITIRVEMKPQDEEEPDYNIIENCQIHKGEFTKGCPEIESFACCECCIKPDCGYRLSTSSIAKKEACIDDSNNYDTGETGSESDNDDGISE